MYNLSQKTKEVLKSVLKGARKATRDITQNINDWIDKDKIYNLNENQSEKKNLTYSIRCTKIVPIHIFGLTTVGFIIIQSTGNLKPVRYIIATLRLDVYLKVFRIQQKKKNQLKMY